MPRSGITSEKVFQAALDLVDQRGIESLTIQNLARYMDIKAPSLYNHISDFGELKYQTSTRVNAHLICLIEKAVQGKKRRAALLALVHTCRQFALDHPGLYQLSGIFPPKQSKQWSGTFLAMRDLFGKVIKNEYDLPEDEVRSVARAIRSLVHGFVSIELSGGWSQIIDIETSFDQCVNLIIHGIETIEKNKKKANKNKIPLSK